MRVYVLYLQGLVLAACLAVWWLAMPEIHLWNSSFSPTPFWVLPCPRLWVSSVLWWPSWFCLPSKDPQTQLLYESPLSIAIFTLHRTISSQSITAKIRQNKRLIKVVQLWSVNDNNNVLLKSARTKTNQLPTCKLLNCSGGICVWFWIEVFFVVAMT